MTARAKLRGDRCQCPTCGERFNSTRAFDKHRIGPYAPMGRRCLTPAEMTTRGMSVSAAGLWITSAMPILGARARAETAIGTDPLPAYSATTNPGADGA